MNSFSKYIAGAACCFVLLFGAFTRLHAQDSIAAQVFAQLNQARSQAGLAPLVRNAQLDAAAQGHANDLMQNGVALGHRGSDGSSIQQRIASAGYTASVVGENWAAYRSLANIMGFWLSDPPHRQNILDPNYHDIGIGVATNADGELIAVTDFGALANSPQVAPVAQAPNAPKNARATPTRPKPAAPKPTRTPTPKPTAAKKVVRTITPTPEPEPTRVALVIQSSDASEKSLRARGRSARLTLQGDAATFEGAAETAGDSLRMALGEALTFAGTLLLGVAWIGHRRSKLYPFH